jgi:antitoxin ParD1/3/4
MSDQINSGKDSAFRESANENSGLFKLKEIRKLELVNELKKGEDSGMIRNFNRKAFLKDLHAKHL